MSRPGLRRALGAVRRRARAALPGPAAPPRRALVEEFTPEGLSGWVEVPDERGVRVQLCVGDTEVMATWALDRTDRAPGPTVRGFSLRTRDLWAYCSRTDRVTVRIDGVPVPIAGHGLWLVPASDGPHGLAGLRREREAGRVFGRTGRLQLSKGLDRDWQERVLALYARTREVLAAERGLDAFLMYGTLLGAVREGGFIGHDNDFDAGYVSRHTEPRQAARELQEIALLLVEHGMQVDLRRSVLHVHDADDPQVRIDLFHLFFDEGGTLRFAWGAAGTRRLRRADWHGVREAEFVGHPVLMPVAAELLVEVLYGSGWRRPVPGFDWVRERRQVSVAAKVPRRFREEVRWADRYARSEVPPPSPFVEHVLARADLPADVVDLGCGQGQDALALAAAGRTVTGVDLSPVGVRQAREAAAARGLADRAAFSVLDVGDADGLSALLDGAREQAGGGPLLVYARFLLHAVPERVQETLLGVLRDRSRPGDVVATEVRTLADAAVTPLRGNHFRRHVDGSALGRRLAADGYALLEEREGTGLSPYRGEDPVLYRVLARRT